MKSKQALLIKALNHQWHPQLVRQYGELKSPTPEKQLIQGEKWLQKHRDDPDLLLALGLICRRLSFWGKARDYLSSAVALQPSTQAYLCLAEVLEKTGDSDASVDTYRRGLLAAQSVAGLKPGRAKLPFGNCAADLFHRARSTDRWSPAPAEYHRNGCPA